MTIGERIKKIRTNLHISQAELARRMGVKQQAVSQFEKSDNLKYETIKKISDALDVSLSSFLDDEIFNAIDSDDASAETKILNKRINEILENEDLPDKERQKQLEHVITQGEILQAYHLNNVNVALNYAKNHNYSLDNADSTDSEIIEILEKKSKNEYITPEEHALFSNYFGITDFKTNGKDVDDNICEMKENNQRKSNFGLQLFSEPLSIEEKKAKLNNLFKKLNTTGQDKAIEQVELLTKIPEYQQDEQNLLKKND